MLYDCKQDCEDGQIQARYFEKLAFDWSYANQANDDVELWCDLGEMYLYNHGAEVNSEQSATWFCKAAKRGYAEAQYSFAEAYRFQMGVSEDINEAIKWCQLAADQGHAMAQANLVHMKEELAARKANQS